MIPPSSTTYNNNSCEQIISYQALLNGTCKTSLKEELDEVYIVLWRSRIGFRFGRRPTSIALAPKHQSTRAAPPTRRSNNPTILPW
jgi:hypothetical protein